MLRSRVGKREFHGIGGFNNAIDLAMDLLSQVAVRKDFMNVELRLERLLVII